MVVLQDLASDMSRPISLPTFAFMLGYDVKSETRESVYDIKSLRVAFGQEASDGHVITWLSYRRSVGRGEASSGLAFDTIIPKSPQKGQ
jgi:hypothetical protein